MNIASGGDGIPVELFQILKNDAVKVLHSICQQIWKTQQCPQDWKRSVFIAIPKKRKGKSLNHVQLLHPYMTTGKTIASTRQTFDDKVKSLPFTCY